MPHRPSEIDLHLLDSAVRGEFRNRHEPVPSDHVTLALALAGKRWLVGVTGDRDGAASGTVVWLAGIVVAGYLRGRDALPATPVPAYDYLAAAIAQVKSDPPSLGHTFADLGHP